MLSLSSVEPPNALLNAVQRTGRDVKEEHFVHGQLPAVKGINHFHVAYSRLAACHSCFSLTVTMEARRKRGRQQDAIFGQ